MSEYINLLISDFRTDHPGIVEEWERQREDALEQGDPVEEWPGFSTPADLAWWLRSEVELARELAHLPNSLERERGIEAYCLAALHDIVRMSKDRHER